jgi:hypothetical protein
MKMGVGAKGTSMFELDMDLVRKNAAQATTTDLLERVTVCREGMEPAALDAIETELRRRGVSFRDQEAFGESHAKVVLRARDGTPRRCHFCSRAAVAEQWGWRRLFGLVPLFPQHIPYCERHRPPNRGKSLPPPVPSRIE